MKKHYSTKFRSLKSLNEYEFKLNLSSGYYQIISEWGNLKYQGYTLFEPRNLNYNNYALNVINEFYDWSLKINNSS